MMTTDIQLTNKKKLTSKKINAMKKLIMIILVAIVAGCHDYKNDIATLTKEKESLQTALRCHF